MINYKAYGYKRQDDWQYGKGEKLAEGSYDKCRSAALRYASCYHNDCGAVVYGDGEEYFHALNGYSDYPEYRKLAERVRNDKLVDEIKLRCCILIAKIREVMGGLKGGGYIILKEQDSKVLLKIGAVWFDVYNSEVGSKLIAEIEDLIALLMQFKSPVKEFCFASHEVTVNWASLWYSMSLEEKGSIEVELYHL